MKTRKLLVTSFFGLLLGLFVFINNATAATTGSVTATVTAQNIAITVTDGGVAYGTLALGGTADTTSGSKNDTQTATNTGNVSETFTIKGSNSAGWTLSGTAGSETYKHEFCTTGGGAPDPCDSTPTWTALTTSDQTLATGVVGSGTQKFDLKVTVPTSTAATSAQNVDVTVTASAT